MSVTKTSKENTYKSAFVPADWIPRSESDFALEQYKTLYQNITQGHRDGHDVERLCIEYEAIEAFCTDEKIKDFWNKITHDSYMVMSMFTGMFFGYHQTPCITETERNKSLQDVDNHLKKICTLAVSDGSIHDYVSDALLSTMREIVNELADLNPDTVQKSPKRSYSPLATQPEQFFNKLRENISACKIKTHYRSPFHISDTRKAERVFFMHCISKLVHYAHRHKRQNHAMTARILNVIRPDLGVFTDDNVRQTVKTLP